MQATLIKYLILLFGYLAVLYPVGIRVSSLSWAIDSTLIPNLFPAFGLAAFSILWLHALSGVFEPWLRRYIDFDSFVRNTSLLVLIFIILHPLLLFINFNFNFNDIFSNYGARYIWFAIFGWMLLITYDIGKLLKKYDFFVRNWNNILFISTIGFLLIFFHSLALGSDLQSGPLRVIWMFYGITAILATIHTYIIKRFW